MKIRPAIPEVLYTDRNTRHS